jgi:hypothetical protein
MKRLAFGISFGVLITAAGQASALVVGSASLDWTRAVYDTYAPGNNSQFNDTKSTVSYQVGFPNKTIDQTIDDAVTANISNSNGQATGVTRVSLDNDISTNEVQSGSSQLLAPAASFGETVMIGGSQSIRRILFELAPQQTWKISIPYTLSCEIDGLLSDYQSLCFSTANLAIGLLDDDNMLVNSDDVVLATDRILLDNIMSLQEKSGVLSALLTNRSSQNLNLQLQSYVSSTTLFRSFSSITPVPLPGSLPLLAAGLGAIATVVRQRKRR